MTSIYKESRKKAHDLYKRSQGVMIVFLLMCYVVKRRLLFPLMNQIWNAILSTIPAQFITERNISVILQYPYVPLCGLVLILLFSLVTVWELSGIMLCLEYHEQEKPVNLLRLLYLAAFNMKHLLHPKNWLFFIYILIIMPFTDLFSASGMLSSFAIPEYISDFINASPILTLCLVVLEVFLLLLAVRWFYVMQGVLIQGKDFKEACKDSAAMMKKRSLRQLTDGVIYSIVNMLYLVLFLASIFLVCYGTACVLLRGYDTMPIAGLWSFSTFYSPMITALGGNLIRMAVMCYLVANYRVVADKMEICEPPVLPESGVKQHRIWKFRGLSLAISISINLLCILFFTASTITFDVNPDILEQVESNTTITAHKGYCTKAPENTMDAFKLAAESEDTDMIELDIRESKDGVPIVIHNASLLSACGVDEEVYDLTYDEIRSYTACYGFTEEEFPDAYVPTLEEVLQTYGGKIPLLIEIKMDERTPDLPGDIVDLLHKYNCTDSCRIHSGSYEALEAVKAADDNILCGYIIAMGTGSYYNLPCADFFSIEHTFINKTMLSKIHSIGKEVYAWTVDDTSSIRAMAALNVDGVITDDPDEVKVTGYTPSNLIAAYISQMNIKTTGEKEEALSDYESENY